MKKFFITTTTLLSSALLAGAAFAGGLENYPNKAGAPEEPAEQISPLTLGIGGFIDFQAGYTNEDDVFGLDDRAVRFQNDSEIHFKIEGKADSGLEYGAVIEMEADVTEDADGEAAFGGHSDKTYLYLQNKKIGRFEMGNVDGAENRLKVDASSIARATGGIDGDWYDFISTAYISITSPDLPLAHYRGIAEDATKISYYSNRIAGLQAGISFTPDSGNGGTAAGFTDRYGGDFEEIIHGGLNYQREFGKTAVELSLTGTYGQKEGYWWLPGFDYNDLKAWAAGAKVENSGFSVAGSYGDWGESDQNVFSTTDSDDANFWNVGAAYEKGPFGASVTYLKSETEIAEAQTVSVGADYQLAPGLVPYAEITFFDLEDNFFPGFEYENTGNVLLVGTQLNF